MLFMSVLVVSGVSLYKAGKLTTKKMQLQNAADAAAYSMAVVEARDLNFAAYMNRAIVANEVGIGQLVGLASWAFHWRSFADFLMAYDTLFIGPGTLGISTPIMQTITNVAWRVPGEAFINVLSPIANIGTSVLHNINRFYGLASWGYHIVAVIFAVGVLDETIKQNGPPGTKISDFGILALIAHIATYGVLPDLPGQQFTTAYSPTKGAAKDEFLEGGYGRLAALVRDSRDPFTKGRGWELRPPGFPIDINESFKIDFGIAAVSFSIWFRLDLSLQRKGGSELRVVLPATGNLTARNFNWSSADATGLFFELGGGIHAKVTLFPSPFTITIFDGGGNVLLANSRLKIWLTFGGNVSEEDPECVERNNNLEEGQEPENCTVAAGSGLTILDVPFPTSAPFGAGFTQAGKATPNKLNYDDMLLSPIGPIETEHYGDAPNNMLAWMSPGPTGPMPPVGVAAGALPINDTRTRVNKTYGGLPHYVDTTGNTSFFGIGAPNLIVGLVLDDDDFNRSVGGGAEKLPAGRMGVTDALADNELAVLSKSELYFSRPLDVSHFARLDGQEEYGSAFNPYWQARLIDTAYPDRILALLIQQKQDFIHLGTTIELFFDDLLSYLPGF
jgi:hypothetical protein